MKKLAKLKKLDIQDVQQRYVLEEFAEKISLSKYNKMLVLKGGFVVSTLLGLDTRMTRDIDVTCKSTIYSLEEMENILQTIVETKSESFFDYSIDRVIEAQIDDYYSGFIAQIIAKHANTLIKIKLDISNNTLIFPNALKYNFNSLFSTKKIELMTYPIENIIAEKYETTLDRGEYNTRMRDLFDVYLLMNANTYLIDQELLVKTIIEVSKDRDTLDNLKEFDDIVEILETSYIFNKHFQSYKEKQYPYMNVTLKEIFEKFKLINQMIIVYQKTEVPI
ncbi:MAG: nucleotidyl transferase AbiEii/AbiGii toxin family protein [Coprobacillus sp.]|nr:nucleotidyl transferase AbiEii/AbiGii toxin family protein [Coprobacillus sp.]MBS7125186.1 nucleotidyl transferase AbiEii/AbiGii toxin family protein [Coprobacillus sp.]